MAPSPHVLPLADGDAREALHSYCVDRSGAQVNFTLFTYHTTIDARDILIVRTIGEGQRGADVQRTRTGLHVILDAKNGMTSPLYTSPLLSSLCRSHVCVVRRSYICAEGGDPLMFLDFCGPETRKVVFSDMRPSASRLVRVIPRSGITSEAALRRTLPEPKRSGMDPPSLIQVLLKRKEELGAAYPANIRIEPPMPRKTLQHVPPDIRHALMDLTKER